MKDGDKVICQSDDWFNAFGETTHAVHCGMRLTVIDSHYFGGLRFLQFKETPEGNSYLATGFKPLRALN